MMRGDRPKLIYGVKGCSFTTMVRESGDGDGFFDLWPRRTYELKMPTWVRANVPPNFLALSMLLSLTRRPEKIFVGRSRLELFGNAGRGKRRKTVVGTIQAECCGPSRRANW